MKIWISGICGRMGQKIQEWILKSETMEFVGGVDKDQGSYEDIKKTDLILDFSSPEGNKRLFETLLSNNLKDKSILIGTTGLEESQKSEWKKLSTSNRVMIAANTSLGIITLVSVLSKVATTLKGFDIELTEAHHRNKKDAPSGTALLLADSIIRQRPELYVNTDRNKLRDKNEIGVVSIRGGSVFGEHSLRFLSDEEELEFSHRALSRDLFAKGALHLGAWLEKQQNGFYSIFDYKE